MIQTNKRSVEQNLYRWGLLLLPVLIILFILYHINLFIPTRILPPCMFHLLTGYSCPGCGCTRAVQSLLAGDLFSSLCYHPLILYCTLFYLCFMLSHTLAHLASFLKKKLPSSVNEGSPLHILLHIRGIKARQAYLYTGIILFVGFGLIRLALEILLTV